MRNQVKRIGLLAATAALLLAAMASAANAQDYPDGILLKSGQRYAGIRILRADIDGIVYERFGGTGDEKTIPASDVEDISWGDGGHFRRAMEVYEDGDLERALEMFRDLPETGPRDFWYGPYRALMIGKCLYRMKQYAASVPVFQSVSENYPRSFYVVKAIQGEALADDITIESKMCAWTAEQAMRYFESGGTEEP